MADCQTIPFRIQMRRLYRGGDLLHHELSFGVAGVHKPSVVVIAHDGYCHPYIEECIAKGSVALEWPLIEGLAFKCFALLSDAILEQGGESGWWTIPDISQFVTHQFDEAVTDQIFDAFKLQVDPDLTVKNVCLTADDDAI